MVRTPASIWNATGNLKQPNRIITEALVKYVRTFRGLEFASDQSIATFLYDDMGFIRLSPLKVTNSVRRKAALGAGNFRPWPNAVRSGKPNSAGNGTGKTLR